MATVMSLQFLAINATVETLLNHDRLSLEQRERARHLIKQLSTQSFTAVSADVLETFLDRHPLLLTGELLNVLAAPHLKRLKLNQCHKILCNESGLEHLKSVMKKCTKLEYLEFNECHPPLTIMTELCNLIGQHVNALTSVSFEDCNTIGNEHVEPILTMCQHLSHLNLSMCSGITDDVFNIQDAVVQSMSSCYLPAQHLSCVDLSCNRQLSSTCIRHLALLCGPSLRALNVTCTGMDCTLLLYLCGYDLSSAVQIAAAANMKSHNYAKVLEMSQLLKNYQDIKAEISSEVNEEEQHDGRVEDQLLNVECPEEEAQVKTKMIVNDRKLDESEEFQEHPSRTQIECRWTRNFIPNITALDINNIDFDRCLVEICFREFFKINQRLMRLNVNKTIDDNLLSQVRGAFTNLRSLSLSECDNISSQGLAYLLSECNKRIMHLSLEGMYFITDDGLYPLFQQESNISSLMLCETYITDKTLHRIAEYLGPKLTVLHLSWCEEISDQGLAAIVANCPCLTDFAIRHCVTSKGTLIQLVENCPDLTAINVSAINCLVDDIIITMATRLNSLSKLDVSWNSELTDVAVSALLSNCRWLIDLCLDGNKHITCKAFLPLIAELPRWRRCQAFIKLKKHLSSDEEYEDLFVPTRSTSYASCLRFLSLQYCYLVNDRHLAEFVAICRGTLTIKDSCGEKVAPKLLHYR